jgi:tetratricopeptide (TPR) repeat protein
MAGEGRLAQALDAFDEALRQSRHRRSAPVRFIRHERGRMFALAGNDSMALVELGHALDAAVDEDEGDDLVWFYESKAVLEHSRGMVHERGGNRAAAREAYARALLEDLSYHPAHLRLGVLAMAEGDTATALAELGLAAETGRTDAPTRLAYGTLLAALRRLPEAEAELLAVTEMAPYYAEAWFLLAMVRDWRGKGEDAMGAYHAFLQRARRDDPRRAQVEQLVAVPTP